MKWAVSPSGPSLQSDTGLRRFAFLPTCIRRSTAGRAALWVWLEPYLERRSYQNGVARPDIIVERRELNGEWTFAKLVPTSAL